MPIDGDVAHLGSKLEQGIHQAVHHLPPLWGHGTLAARQPALFTEASGSRESSEVRSQKLKATVSCYRSLLWNDRNGVDLHQVIRVRQPRHEQESDQGRIGPVAPHTLKCF